MDRTRRIALLASTGIVTPTYGLRAVLDSVTSAATGIVTRVGSLAQSLVDVTVSATAEIPSGTTATFTAQPASFDDRQSAWRQGLLGATSWGRYWRIPTAADPNVGDYVYFTMDGAGVDPGNHVAELSGYTGHVVDLTGPQASAATVAAAARAQVTISGLTIGGTGADFSVTGSIGTASVGGMHGATELGAGGTRRRTPQYNTTALSGRIGQSFTWGGGTVLPTALGCYLNTATTDVRIALYSGGTAGAGGHTSAALVAEGVIPGGGSPGWRWIEIVPAEVSAITNGTVLRLVMKSNGLSEPGYIGTGDPVGTDYAANLEVYDTMSTDPAVAFPATLAAETADTTNAVYLLAAVQYRSADGTASQWTTRWGVQVSDPTTLAQTSSLTSPDPGGAELYMGANPPPVLGLELDSWAVAWGTAHGAQPRIIVSQGGTVGNAAGSTILYQAQTTGTATQAWGEYAIPGNVAVSDLSVLHWGVKNNTASVNFRYAANVDRVQADPDDNPTDFVDASEYEIFNSVDGLGGTPVYDTNPANATVSPVDPLTAALAGNTNYPGAYLLLRVPADTVA